MLTGINDLNKTATTAMDASSKPTQSTADAQSDRFLKLLVAQLNNQDPMNPMDNAQMTSQMAQINTVSGIQQLNDTVKSIGAQFGAIQALQGASLVGRGVLVQSNTLSIDGGTAKGAIDLPSAADKVSIQILSPGGQPLQTLDLGPLSAGRHSFNWDASSYNGSGNPSFKVIATNGDKNVASTSFAQGTVVGIDVAGGAMNIQLKGRDTVAYEAIQAIF